MKRSIPMYLVVVPIIFVILILLNAVAETSVENIELRKQIIKLQSEVRIQQSVIDECGK